MLEGYKSDDPKTGPPPIIQVVQQYKNFKVILEVIEVEATPKGFVVTVAP